MGDNTVIPENKCLINQYVQKKKKRMNRNYWFIYILYGIWD